MKPQLGARRNRESTTDPGVCSSSNWTTATPLLSMRQNKVWQQSPSVVVGNAIKMQSVILFRMHFCLVPEVKSTFGKINNKHYKNIFKLSTVHHLVISQIPLKQLEAWKFVHSEPASVERAQYKSEPHVWACRVQHASFQVWIFRVRKA